MACIGLGSVPCATIGNTMIDSMIAHGYVYIQHPAVSPRLIAAMKATSRRFFSSTLPQLPEMKKQAIRTEIGFRGHYRYVGASGKDDPIDCFSIGNDVPDPFKLREAYYRSAGWEQDEMMRLIDRQNPWHLIGDDELRAVSTEYYAACHNVSMDALRHIALALGVRPSADADVDAELFAKGHTNADHNLELKHYPSVAALKRKSIVEVRTSSTARSGPKVLRRQEADAFPEGRREAPAAAAVDSTSAPKVRLDAHRDLSTVTLLAQDALGGLEVFDAVDEKYIPVPVLEDALLLNAGTFLEKWTSGLIEATMHRVRVLDGSPDRCSVVFFCFPNYDYVIEPLKLKEDGEPEKSFQAGDMMPTH